jgi:propanediol dehydratase large subunit
MQKLIPTVARIAAQVALIGQTPGAQAQVTALEAATSRVLSALDAAEAALNSFHLDSAALSASMTALANAVNALAASAWSGASLASVTAGVNALDPKIAAVEGGFATLATTMNRLAPAAAGLEGDAVAIEDTVSSLCALVPTTCP